MRRLVRAVTAALLATAAVTTAVPSAAAQAPAGTVRFLSQTPWVTRGGEFVLRLAITARDPSDLEVAVTVYPAVATRSAFNETLDDRVTGSAISVKSERLSDLAPEADGAVTVRLPIQDPSQPRDPVSRVRLRGAGVYPVVVELRGDAGGARVDRFVTHLVHLPEPINGPKLATALVLPIASPPALQPDGERRLSGAWSTALRALVDATESYADVPLTLVPQPETVQALSLSTRAEDRETVLALGRVGAGRLVLGGPYVRLSEPAYTGFESEAAAQRAHGLAVVTPLLPTPPDIGTAVLDDGLDEASVARLVDSGVKRAIVRDRALAPLSLRTTLTQPFQIRGRSNKRLTAAIADEGLSSHFTRDAPAALRAHGLLADLAVLYFDSPGLVRGAVALPPTSWRASPDFLAALLDGLRTSPILAAVDVSGLFAGVTPARGTGRNPLVRDPAPATALTLPLAELRRARRQLATLEGLTLAENPSVAALEERILASQSVDLRARQRSDYAREAREAIDEQLGGIRVPPNQSITLTDRRGEIPVTILREVPYPVRVVVELSSDRLQFPEGASAQLDLTRRNTTTRFTVQARASGTFPLQVKLKSPDGRIELSTGRFTIRSRAASGVGVILSVSALWFLIVWWGRHIFRARRAHRAAAA